ncbi:hypothetical protein SDC9_183855 [bioreactor metagenome]|uniref:Uncharacterized protein n=1 Tax=bioreactor metagenome TaxID=1076179 RepID=A0A645HCV3_9ZZZZ
MGDRQITDLCLTSDIQFKGVEQFLRILLHFSEIYKPSALHGLSSEIDVLCYAHVGDKHQFLVDDTDPKLLSIKYRIDGDFLPINEDISAVLAVDSTQYLDQGRFARSIFTEQRMYLTGSQLQ